MGVGMRITPAFTEQLVIGIVNLWRDLGVLAADLEIPVPSRMPLLADDYNVYYLNAETSGLFIPTVEHWISVHTGELLGRIVSPVWREICRRSARPSTASCLPCANIPWSMKAR